MKKFKKTMSALTMPVLARMKRWKPWLLPLASALLITALAASGALRRLDRWTQDWLFQHRGVTSRDIVIIGIDEDALDILGPYDTWDRTVMASALEALAADKDNLPAAVAIDVLYAGNSTPEADERLADAARALGKVVTATVADFGVKVTYEEGIAVAVDSFAVLNYEQPYKALLDSTVQGHINTMSDKDGITRHALLYVEPAEGERVYSMAAQTAKTYLESMGKKLVTPNVGARGLYYVPYTGRPGDFYDGVSIAYLIGGMIPSTYWADKIVLIGPYAAALQDAYFTPINKGRQMYGVEIQANVIQCLLEGKYKTDVPEWPQLLAVFILSAAAMFLFLRLKLIPGAGLCLGLAALGIGAPILMYQLGFVTHPLWLPSSALVLYILALADHYRQASKEKQALALEKERIGAELALATRIQASSLLKEFPPFPDRKEFDIYASMNPAKEVGGDLYDFFLIDDDHLGLVIADVSGKGVPASLFMMVTMTLLRHVASHEISPAKALTTINAEICRRNPEEMFVTVWLGVLEISTGKLTAANAGHEYPALRKANGEFELFKDKHGFVIGGMEGVRYRQYELILEKGDTVFVYTDGVPEATNAQEELFGTDRMIRALRSVGDGTPKDCLDAVNRDVQAFVGDAPQFDDLTMLCMKYLGPVSDLDAGRQSGVKENTTSD